MRNISLLLILFSLLIVACGGGVSTEGQTAQAPEDPETVPVVDGLDSISAAYDQEIASVIPGYLAISWIDLSDVRFEDRYYEEVKSYLLYPKFGDVTCPVCVSDILFKMSDRDKPAGAALQNIATCGARR